MRACLWLGLEKDQENWKDCCHGGQPTIFAEIVCWIDNSKKSEGLLEVIIFFSPISMSVSTGLSAGMSLMGTLTRKRRSLNLHPQAGGGTVDGISCLSTAALLNQKKASLNGKRRSLRIKLVTLSPIGQTSQNHTGQIW